MGRLRPTIGALIVLALTFYVGTLVGQGQTSLQLPWQKQQAVTKGLPGKLDYTTVNQVYKSLKDNYDGQLNAGQLEDGLKHGLAEATKDPYTVYFTPKEAKEFNDQLNNSFAGIGAKLKKDADGNIVIDQPIDGFAAQKAGLQPHDIIIAINGQDATKLTLDDAVSKIRGPINTKVSLQIIRDRSQQLNFTITRQEITLPSVTTKILDGNVGYMQINSFADDTSDLAAKAAKDFKDKQVKAMILDLRDDPGGLLQAAIDVSNLWLPEGKTILQEKRGSTVQQTYYAQGGGVLQDVPTVVLVNGGSASASEITTGALHDNKAAYVIGEKTYGKGVVQQLIDFADGSQLKVTVASWYRPNGQNINKKGIQPDQKVDISDADAKAGNDTQLQAAQAYLNK